MAGYPVVSLIETDFILNIAEYPNQTTTKSFIVLPVPARWVEFKYVKLGTTTQTGTMLYVVPNAYTTTEGTQKLATAGQRLAIPYGDSYRLDFSATDPCIRLDFVTDAATEAGSIVLIFWGTDS